jgi:hypothetical protein
VPLAAAFLAACTSHALQAEPADLRSERYT